MVISGFHAVEETLKSSKPKGTLYLARKSERARRLITLAKEVNIRVVQVAPKELDRICGHNRHRGAALKLEDLPQERNILDLSRRIKEVKGKTSLILFLDGITDPQNLGSILRSADQFQADLVILPSKRSVHRTDSVLRTSSGASLYVPLAVVPNLVGAIRQCKKEGFWIYGACMEGKRVDMVELEGRVGLVLGSEGRGLRRLVREECDFLIRIPAAGQVDSFNVSVAAGILMYEIRKKQAYFQDSGTLF